MKIDHIPGCILGVFWTTASWSSTENSIQITNKRKNLLDKVHKFLADFGYNYTIYKSSEIKRKNTSNESHRQSDKMKVIYYQSQIDVKTIEKFIR